MAAATRKTKVERQITPEDNDYYIKSSIVLLLHSEAMKTLSLRHLLASTFEQGSLGEPSKLKNGKSWSFGPTGGPPPPPPLKLVHLKVKFFFDVYFAF